jgi:hypothetical protein
MRYDYVWEKFHLAVLGLAGSERSLQERLADAYQSYLIHAGHDGVPDEIHGDFERLRTMLTREQAKGDEGVVTASVRVLSEVEVIHLIDLIVVSMYARVAKYGPNARD